MPSTDITPAANGGDLLSPEDLAALQAAQRQEVNSDLLTTPILKIGQALTREVSDGDAEAGEFINSLTGESLGNAVEFIVAWYHTGRFAVNKKTKRAFVAFGDTIPEAWADLDVVGDAFVGSRFDEHPDAEEVFKKRVNNKEIEWGTGPRISTTHNFTGLVLISPLEGSDEDDELQPVRLSLQRTQSKVAGKWLTLLSALGRSSSYWDVTWQLTTKRKDFASGPAYLLEVKKGRKTTNDERLLSVNLAQAVAGGRTVDNSEQVEGGERTSAPDAKGGLAV